MSISRSVKTRGGWRQDLVDRSYHSDYISIFEGVMWCGGEEIRTVALHDGEELDDDLRGRTDEDLALAAALGVDNVVLRIHVSLRVYSVYGSRHTKQSFFTNYTRQHNTLGIIYGLRTRTETRTILS